MVIPGYRLLAACLLILMILSITSCGNSLKFYGEFCGNVVDKETNSPIEGVVIIASWVSCSLENPFGTTPYSVSEVVSNSSGEFCLKGKASPFFPYQPSVVIFKSGYVSIQTTYYPQFINNYYLGSISWVGNRAIVKLDKLTTEERIKKKSEIDKYIYNDDKFKQYRVQFDKELARERTELEPYREQMRQGEYNKQRNKISLPRKPSSKGPINKISE